MKRHCGFTRTGPLMVRTVAAGAALSICLCGSAAMDHAAGLRDEDVSRRREAAEALQQLGPKAHEALPSLMAATGDPDPTVRRLAVEAIGKMGGRGMDGADAIIRAMDDPDVHVRRAAVVAIVKLGTFPSTAFPPYVRRLGDPDSLVRELTISSITDLGRDAVPTLRRALEDSSAATRAGAARALGLLGKEGLSASNALKEASNDEEEMVAESARRALRTMGIEPPKQ